MEQVQDKDLVKLKKLLQNTGEFIAYFELAETKMAAWKTDLEQQALIQQKKTENHLNFLHTEIESLRDVLTHAGMARLRLHISQALKDGEAHINLLKKTGDELIHDIRLQHNELSKTLNRNLHLVERYTDRAIRAISFQLAEYDINQFHQTVQDSHLHIEKVSSDTIRKSAGLLRNYQWRSIVFSLITTLITALSVSLYVCNEAPWEVREQVQHERAAGKALLSAWSVLSQEEKDKIMNSSDFKG
ncbi:hypothetical protein ACFORL_12225 [Legionella dresdenensis]|uniref:Uncharacterized protein n=1 Tax=Legionella dresdenensis TaxID=450200 RepID=A0ABV8CHP6_9GAMM